MAVASLKKKKKNVGVFLSNLEGKSKLTSSEKQLGVGGGGGESQT